MWNIYNKKFLKKINILMIIVIFSISLFSCQSQVKSSNSNIIEGEDGTGVLDKEKENKAEENKEYIINVSGKNIEERFNVPRGFQREEVEKNSFEEYLRKLPLKEHGAKVLYYDGREKVKNNVYVGVVDMEIGDRDLQQCADAVMRLRAEYLYKNKRYNEIKFHFVNGFLCDYNKWRQGYRISINGNNALWIKKAQVSDSYESFRKYLDIVFAYASTISLEKELIPVDKAEMKIGDVYIKGDNPGHAVIVIDMAKNIETGEKVFMLAQSYMPAQETQILCSDNSDISPWYSLSFTKKLYTPEWTFDENKLRRF